MILIGKALIFMGSLGFSMAVVLALSTKLFYVKEDPLLEKIKALLPGSNCGGCGFAGCEGAATALINKKAGADVCVAGGAETAEKIAEALGLSVTFSKPIMQTGCRGSSRSETKYFYRGLLNCKAEHLLYGGSSNCEKACLGHGSCVIACPFGAISINREKYPEINPDICKCCGRCVNACPPGVISIVSQTDKLLKFNLEGECLAPCQQKCPAQIDIPLFISQMVKGDNQSALLTIKEHNPLVLTVSRLCTHICENICRRNIADEGVAIGKLGRFLGEWEMESGRHVPIVCAPDTGHKVAIVGSGPAGLSCAYFLKRLGHAPVIFEKRSGLGGMLRYGIPEYRLPRNIVDWEVKGILDLGIEFMTKSVLGRDFSIADLKKDGFEAIFLGIGAWSTPLLCIDGENSIGVVNSLDFLSEAGVNITSLKNEKVVVVGESNTAMDCARICIRLKASSVIVICPNNQKNMSARKSDVERAMEEGVKIMFLTIPSKINSDKNGVVTHIKYMELMPVENGKKSEIYNKIPDSGNTIEADLVISAYERKPDLYYLCHKEDPEYEFKASKKWTLTADKDTLLAARPDVFTAGDMYSGRSTVVNSVAGGRKAARSIHFLLSSGRIPVPDNLLRRINTESIIKNVELSSHIPRVKTSSVPPEIRKKSLTQDVVNTITGSQASEEARRCLRCGTTCYDK